MFEDLSEENYLNLIRHKIASIANAMLANEMSFLSGARKISLFRHMISNGYDDSDLLIFFAIDVETAHLPLGNFSPGAEQHTLSDLQDAIDASEMWAKIFGKPACESLVKRFHS